MEDTGKCTCGMELGKKLASVEHLLSGAPTLVCGGQPVKIDLTSNSPWSGVGANDYFELELRYGPTDKDGLRVQLDTQGKRFKIGNKEGAMPGLQAEVEQQQLLRMIKDLLTQVQDKQEAKSRLEKLLAVGEGAQAGKRGVPSDRDALRVSDVLRPFGVFEDIAKHIDASAERWFKPVAGLTEDELMHRLAKDKALADDGDPMDAREDLEALSELLPDHHGVKRQLAAVYLQAYSDFKLREAVRLLEGVRSAMPNDATTEELYGDAQLKQGDAAAAKKAYEHAHELAHGESAWALFGLGQVAELQGEWGEARQFYVRACRQAREPGLRRCLEQMEARIALKLKKTN